MTHDENGKRAGRRGGRRARHAEGIDISEALEAPVRVKRDGELGSVDPYEAMLRQHARKAIAGKSVPSMKLVLDEAEKHKLIKQRPSPMRGGVFVVPKDLPEEVQRQIFDDPHAGTEKAISMWSICFLIAKHLSFERLLRCFNGRH